MKKGIITIIAAYCFIFMVNVEKGFAQLKGDRLMGGTGLDAASQAPAETFTLLVPLYFYNAGSLKDADGSKTNSSPDINAFITGIGMNVVTSLKIFGGNYGATLLLPFATNRIEGNNLSSKSSFAFSDIYVQPFQLGWKAKRADFSFNYGLYIPSGKYESGGDNNSGLGMLTNEFSAGTTLRLDQKGTLTFSTLLSYEIHGNKKDTEIKTGDILSVEGGLGKGWYIFNGSKTPSSLIKAGLIYYIQCKTTNDQIPYGNVVFSPGKDRVYALGLEGNVLLVKPKLLVGFRWFDEFSAVNRFQGNTFFVTLAHIFSLDRKK